MKIRPHNLTAASTIAALSLGGLAHAAESLEIILNEANCVSNTQFLDNGEEDTGIIGDAYENNAKDWIELLVTDATDCQTDLSIAGWKIEWRFDKDQAGTDTGSGEIVFKDVAPFNKLRQGQIVVLMENKELWYLTSNGNFEGGYNDYEGQFGDTFNSSNDTKLDFAHDDSFNPENTSEFAEGDWLILAEVSKNGVASGTGPSTYKVETDFCTFTGEVNGEYIGDDSTNFRMFVVNNDDWEMRILDDSGNVVQDWRGENVSGFGGGGVGKDEVLKLEQYDGSGTWSYSDDSVGAGNWPDIGTYLDGDDSTCGRRNEWANSANTQDLSDVRDWWSSVLAGDLDLDGTVTAGEVSTIQANIGISDPDWYDGDVDGDGDVDINDKNAAQANQGSSWSCP